MAVSMCIMNMKGGVGKTTISFHLTFAAAQSYKKVLAIDLDPQANLSQALMGFRPYARFIEENDPSIVQIVEGYAPPSRNRKAPRPPSTVSAIRKLRHSHLRFAFDLIPSRLELARVLRPGKINVRSLAHALSAVSENYDLIIIDCAPTDSVLTEVAYFASRYVLVPVKEEFFATIGFPLLKSSLDDFRRSNRDHNLDVCGIVVVESDYKQSEENRTANREIVRACNSLEWKIFETRIPHSPTFPKSARQGAPLASTTNARARTWKPFQKFARELFTDIGVQGHNT